MSGLQEHIARAMRTENDRIEADLLSLPGVHRDLTADEATKMGLTIVRQQHPGTFGHEYRGVWAQGRPLIDHHPEWGEVRGLS